MFMEKRDQKERNDKQKEVGGDVVSLWKASVLDAEPVVHHEKIAPPGFSADVSLVRVEAP